MRTQLCACYGPLEYTPESKQKAGLRQEKLTKQSHATKSGIFLFTRRNKKKKNIKRKVVPLYKAMQMHIW